MFKIPVIISLIYCTSPIFFRKPFVNGFETSFIAKSDCIFKQYLHNNSCDVVPFYLNEFREKDESFTCKQHNQNVTKKAKFRSNENAFNEDLKVNKFQSYFGMWKNYHLIFLPQENVGEKCMKDMAFLISSIEKKELWALKMIDATAKIPSGLLSGNVNQFGDFDECLSIRKPVKGKYFLASLDIFLETLGLSAEVDSLVHAHRWISSNSTDLGHRVPKVSSIYWGICLTSSCSAKDLQITLENHLQAFTKNINVDEKMTVTIEDKIHYSTGKTITMFLFGLVTALIVVASLSPMECDKLSGEGAKLRQIIMGFSFRKNFKALMDTSLKEEIRSVDGARALNVLALLLSHKSMALFFNPYVNRTEMAEILSMPWAIIGRTAIIYTDSFLLISGFLTATTFLRDLKRTGNIHFKDKLINRVFRILPTLISVILFCTYILPDLGSGPLWDMVVTEHSRLCKRNMWRNFLFIHNFMGFETMCLTHTHQLGIDMQLFVFTSVVVFLLWQSGSRGTIGLLIMAALSTALRFWVTMTKELSMVVYHGMPITKFFDTATFSYILPTHRLTIYLMGVGLAYFMSLERSHIPLNKIQVAIGWVISISLGLLSMLGPWHMGLKSYEYDKLEAAVYGAFSPISWGLFVSWCLWTCSNSCAGWFGDFLSWRGFRIFSKIAYGVYLIQFPVFFYNVGRQKYSGYYKPHMMFDITEIGFILLASAVLALWVEMPFTNMCKVLQGKNDFNVTIEATKQKHSGNNSKCKQNERFTHITRRQKVDVNKQTTNETWK